MPRAVTLLLLPTDLILSLLQVQWLPVLKGGRRKNLDSGYKFVPVAIKTLGAFGPMSHAFLK